MVSLKNNQSGFTIVELLIVIVIIGILSLLVVTQIIGATQSARDAERKTDLGSISQQLEAYFAKTGGYPTIDNLNAPLWRSGNKFSAGSNDSALADPSSATSLSLVGTIEKGRYSYTTTPAGCLAMTIDNGDAASDISQPCTGFELSAVLETTTDKATSTINSIPGVFQKKSAN